MVLTRSQKDNSNIANLFFGKKKGFFGRLWDRVKKSIGTIIGAIVGGPIGGAIGTLIQGWISENPDIQINEGLKGTSIDLSVVEPDSYPISKIEETLLLSWLDNKFKPTIINIANSTDQNLTLNFSKLSNDDLSKITTVNKALKDISVLKAYALKLLEFGEYNTGLFIQEKFSENYVINKTEAMFIVLDQIEKGAIKYVIDNGLNSNFTLVSDSQLISTIPSVGQVNLDWQGQTVNASIKRYVANQDVTQDQTPLDVTNTDLTSTDTAVHTSSEVIDVQGDPKPQINWLKIGVVGTLSYLALKTLTKSSKK